MKDKGQIDCGLGSCCAVAVASRYTAHEYLRTCSIISHRILFRMRNVSHKILAGKVKVKVTLVKALRLCTGRAAHRGVEV